MRAAIPWTIGLTLASACPLLADNDGNNQRALETAVISPARECNDPSISSRYVPLLRGLHDRPLGYADGSHVYLFTHSAYWPDNGGDFNGRDCHTELAEVGACNMWLTDADPSNDANPPRYIPELSILYRTPNTAAGMTAPYERLGYVGPCFTSSQLPGAELTHGRVGPQRPGGTVAYVGRPAAGRINGKYYFTVTRAKGFSWVNGDFDELYLGVVLDPDEHRYRYHQRPILRMSTVNGVTYEFLEPMLAGWATPGSKPFTQVLSPVGPAHMWGFIPYGNKAHGPFGWAGIQIADGCPGVSLSWNCLYVYLLASDGVWRSANRLDGSIDFVPQDVAGHIGIFGVQGNSLFYNPVSGRWTVVGENLTTDAGAIGCSDDGTGWPAAMSAMLDLPPFTGARTLYEFDTYTQNGWHNTGFFHDIGTTRYVFRGSTERACINNHWGWSSFGACTANAPGCSRTPGMEIVVETIPRN